MIFRDQTVNTAYHYGTAGFRLSAGSIGKASALSSFRALITRPSMGYTILPNVPLGGGNGIDVGECHGLMLSNTQRRPHAQYKAQFI
jgi:hypothetical protein